MVKSFRSKISKSKDNAELANVWGPISREWGHASARNFTHLTYFQERDHKQHNYTREKLTPEFLYWAP